MLILFMLMIIINKCTLPAQDPFCFSLLDIVHVADCYRGKREFIKGHRFGA